LAVGAGWLLGLEFASPSQRAAADGPPPTSTITATVTDGTLTDQITVDVTTAASSVQTATLSGTGDVSVVTALPLSTGSTVSAGSVVAEVDGRPVFALPGQFRFYRDMTVGDTGPDVAQLQHALTASGIPVPADGDFGASTGRAVDRLYKRSGYSAPTTEASAEGEQSPPSTSADAAPNTGSSTASPNASSQGTDAPQAKVPMVPRGELLVFPSLPGVLTDVPGVDSDLSDGARKVTIAAGALVARATVSADSAQTIAAGMEAQLQSGSDRIPATVSQVSAADADGNSTIVLTPTTALPASWTTAPVLATIIKKVVAEQSLIVPARAIVADSNGGHAVLVKSADGSFRTVQVTLLGELDGKVAVRPTAAGHLAVDDAVRVK
jgi:hypothetical protein